MDRLLGSNSLDGLFYPVPPPLPQSTGALKSKTAWPHLYLDSIAALERVNACYDVAEVGVAIDGVRQPVEMLRV